MRAWMVGQVFGGAGVIKGPEYAIRWRCSREESKVIAAQLYKLQVGTRDELAGLVGREPDDEGTFREVFGFGWPPSLDRVTR